MKMAFAITLISMLFSHGGSRGHLMRTMWLAISCVFASTLCFRPSVSPLGGIGWGLYVNQLSPWLFSLTFFISFLAMLSSTPKTFWKSVFSQTLFGTYVLSASLLISMSFLVSNLLSFYILFESSLVPMIFLMAGWGAYQERVEASLYMVMYTVGGSLPFFMLILCIKGPLDKLSAELMPVSVSFLPSSVVCFASTVAFLVKLPLYPLHLWLPKAHVEAPTAGSMLLAGIMLKMGGFGLVCSLSMFSSYWSGKLWILTSMALWGGVLAMAHCLVQVDLKAAIAYSSVAHMSLVIYGAASMNQWGLTASLITMISHGLTSSGLFCLTNWIYELTGTRLISVISGLQLTCRSLASWGVALLTANIPTPPWLSIVGEVMTLPSITAHQSFFLLLPLALMMHLSASFSFNLYTELFQGPPSQHFFKGDLQKVAHLGLWAHIAPLCGLIFFTDKMVLN